MVTQPLQLDRRLGNRGTDRGLPLDLRLEDLAGRPRCKLAVVVGLEDRVCPLDEGECLGIEQHVLLFETECVRRRRTEAVLGDARVAG